MSSPQTIDFKTGLFDDASPEVNVPVPVPVADKPNKWPMKKDMYLFMAHLFLATLAIVCMFLVNRNIDKSKITSPFPIIDESGSVPLSGQAERSSNTQGWCNGDEMICTTTNTAHPAATLRKLVAAVPTGTAKKYVIRMSVTSMEETDVSVNH